MKTLLLASVVATFALVSSVQAGENADKAKTATCSDQAKSCCAKDSCCAGKMVKKADVAVKGATLLVRR